MAAKETIAQWLNQRCKGEHLSLRQTSAKTGLSHTTIAGIRNGVQPSAQTIRKLAWAFGGNGINQLIALEDHLLVLAGYRTEQPEGKEPSEALAQLMDKVSHFSESQIRIMGHFADYISEIEGRQR